MLEKIFKEKKTRKQSPGGGKKFYFCEEYPLYFALLFCCNKIQIQVFVKFWFLWKIWNVQNVTNNQSFFYYLEHTILFWEKFVMYFTRPIIRHQQTLHPFDIKIKIMAYASKNNLKTQYKNYVFHIWHQYFRYFSSLLWALYHDYTIKRYLWFRGAAK